MSNINFEEDRVDSVTQIDQTKDLSNKVIELRNLEDQIKASEDHTKNLKEKAKQLSNFDIPKMMQEMNVSKLILKDGASIEVKPFYGAHIPADKQESAFNWLRENGLGDIIKMMSLLHLVVAKITRQWLMLPLQKVRDMNPSRK